MLTFKTSGGGLTQTETADAVQTGTTNAINATNVSTVAETRVVDCSVTNIPASSSAPSLLSPSPLVNDIKRIEVSCTFGEPIEVWMGNDAMSADSLLFVANQGEGPMTLECIIPTGSYLYFRTASLNNVNAGYLTLNLMK